MAAIEANVSGVEPAKHLVMAETGPTRVRVVCGRLVTQRFITNAGSEKQRKSGCDLRTESESG